MYNVVCYAVHVHCTLYVCMLYMYIVCVYVIHVHCMCCVQIEMEVFDKMDNFVSQGEGDEAYRDLFCDM